MLLRLRYSMFLLTSTLIVTRSASATVPANCPTNPEKFGTTTIDPKILSVIPASIYDGSVTSLRITGQNLDPTWTVVLCPKEGAVAGDPGASISLNVGKSNGSLPDTVV